MIIVDRILESLVFVILINVKKNSPGLQVNPGQKLVCFREYGPLYLTCFGVLRYIVYYIKHLEVCSIQLSDESRVLARIENFLVQKKVGCLLCNLLLATLAIHQ